MKDVHFTNHISLEVEDTLTNGDRGPPLYKEQLASSTVIFLPKINKPDFLVRQKCTLESAFPGALFRAPEKCI
jgi:hypothetical protein